MTINYLLVFKFITIVACLTVGAAIIKKYLTCFPPELIPLLNTTFGIIFNCVWLTFTNLEPMGNVIVDGILLGWASVGLHQLYKQSRDFIRIRKYFHNLDLDRERRLKEHE